MLYEPCGRILPASETARSSYPSLVLRSATGSRDLPRSRSTGTQGPRDDRAQDTDISDLASHRRAALEGRKSLRTLLLSSFLYDRTGRACTVTNIIPHTAAFAI